MAMNRFFLPTIRCRSVAVVLLATVPLLPALPSRADDEAPLGRLFFTPERRQTLDRQRQYKLADTTQAAEEPMLTLNGMVRRSSGKRTAWVNGIPQNDNDAITGVLVRPDARHPGSVTVQEAPGTGTTTLRIGQSHRRGTGETSDPIPPGSILRINPAPPAPSRAAKAAP